MAWMNRGRTPLQPIRVTKGTVELLRSMGVVFKEDGKAPLYEIGKVTPMPMKRNKPSELLFMKFDYKRE